MPAQGAAWKHGHRMDTRTVSVQVAADKCPCMEKHGSIGPRYAPQGAQLVCAFLKGSNELHVFTLDLQLGLLWLHAPFLLKLPL
eukprot:250846-Pelagomonas_calceolata.AAC.1